MGSEMKVALLSLAALCVAATWAASDGVHTVSALEEFAEPAAIQHAAGKVPATTAKTKETAQAKKAVATTVTKKSPVAKKKKSYAKRVKRIVDRSRAVLGEFQEAGRRSVSAAAEMQQGCIMTAAQNPQSSTMNSAAVCAGKAGAYFKHLGGITLTAKFYGKPKKEKMKEEDFGKEAEEEAIEGELVAVEYTDEELGEGDEVGRRTTGSTGGGAPPGATSGLGNFLGSAGAFFRANRIHTEEEEDAVEEHEEMLATMTSIAESMDKQELGESHSAVMSAEAKLGALTKMWAKVGSTAKAKAVGAFNLGKTAQKSTFAMNPPGTARGAKQFVPRGGTFVISHYHKHGGGRRGEERTRDLGESDEEEDEEDVGRRSIGGLRQAMRGPMPGGVMVIRAINHLGRHAAQSAMGGHSLMTDAEEFLAMNREYRAEMRALTKEV